MSDDGDPAGTEPSDGGDAPHGEDPDGNDEVRVWLVEREFNDKGLVTLAYATTDAERQWRVSKAAAALSQLSVTAARDVEPGALTPVDDADLRDRYRTEAERMADRHDPDDPI